MHPVKVRRKEFEVQTGDRAEIDSLLSEGHIREVDSVSLKAWGYPTQSMAIRRIRRRMGRWAENNLYPIIHGQTHYPTPRVSGGTISGDYRAYAIVEGHEELVRSHMQW